MAEPAASFDTLTSLAMVRSWSVMRFIDSYLYLETRNVHFMIARWAKARLDQSTMTFIRWLIDEEMFHFSLEVNNDIQSASRQDMISQQARSRPWPKSTADQTVSVKAYYRK